MKIGCVMPGESAAVFGDALRRLAAAATYLYQDGPRFWYSTQPTVTKLAEDRAEQLKRDADKVAHELDERLRAELRKTGDFSRIHPLPRSGADVPDDLDARLVVLPAEHTYTKEAGSAAETAARAILESRGNTPRLYRNTLVFLAADKVRLQDLDEAVRRFLAWKLLDEPTTGLDPLMQQEVLAMLREANAAGATIFFSSHILSEVESLRAGGYHPCGRGGRDSRHRPARRPVDAPPDRAPQAPGQPPETDESQGIGQLTR